MIATCLQSVGQALLFRAGLGGCVGIVIYVFGAETLAYEVVILLAFADVATGLLKAWKSKTVNSRRFFQKLPMLIGYIVLLGAAYQLSRLVPELSLIQGWCAAFIGLGELISIVENLGQVGVKVPAGILQFLQNLKKEKNIKSK